MSNAEGGSAQFFRHPLNITLPPLEEILKTPLSMEYIFVQRAHQCCPCSLVDRLVQNDL